MNAHARNTDPETSHEAAASVDDVTKKQQAVLYMFKNAGSMTDIELQAMYDLYRMRNELGFPQQSVSGLRTRRHELVSKGLLVDTGDREVTPSGRRAIVWGLREA